MAGISALIKIAASAGKSGATNLARKAADASSRNITIDLMKIPGVGAAAKAVGRAPDGYRVLKNGRIRPVWYDEQGQEITKGILGKGLVAQGGYSLKGASASLKKAPNRTNLFNLTDRQERLLQVEVARQEARGAVDPLKAALQRRLKTKGGPGSKRKPAEGAKGGDQFVPAKESFAGGAGRRFAQTAEDHPILTGLGVALGASEGYDLVAEPLFGGVSDAISGGDLNRTVGEEEAARRLSMQAYFKQKRLERSMAGNLAALANSRPDIYAQLAAGRRLPKGSTVIGGRPREDILNEVALAMSEGAFQPNDDPLSALGGF